MATTMTTGSLGAYLTVTEPRAFACLRCGGSSERPDLDGWRMVASDSGGRGLVCAYCVRPRHGATP